MLLPPTDGRALDDHAHRLCGLAQGRGVRAGFAGRRDRRLIRITEREESQSGAFRLRFSGVLTEPSGTGRSLPASGRVRGKLNPIAPTRPFPACSCKLRAGQSYRVRVSVGSGGDCNANITLGYPDDDTRGLDCRDYTVITPDPSYSGMHVITIEEGTQSPDDESYDVSITPVGPETLRAGRFIGGFGKARGSVSVVAPTRRTCSASTSRSGRRSPAPPLKGL